MIGRKYVRPTGAREARRKETFLFLSRRARTRAPVPYPGNQPQTPSPGPSQESLRTSGFPVLSAHLSLGEALREEHG
jgi:hypothetical protein